VFCGYVHRPTYHHRLLRQKAASHNNNMQLKKAQYAQKHTQAENITSTQTPLTYPTAKVQSGCVTKWIGSSLLGTGRYNFHPPLSRSWAPQYRITDRHRRTDRQTDRIVVIAGRLYCVAVRSVVKTIVSVAYSWLSRAECHETRMNKIFLGRVVEFMHSDSGSKILFPRSHSLKSAVSLVFARGQHYVRDL